jgi:hypothetical protein
MSKDISTKTQTRQGETVASETTVKAPDIGGRFD